MLRVPQEAVWSDHPPEKLGQQARGIPNRVWRPTLGSFPGVTTVTDVLHFSPDLVSLHFHT